MNKIITAKDAATLIQDNDTVAFGAMGFSGWPEEIARAIEQRFLETGSPKNLELKQGSATGDWKERGVTRLGHEGLVKKWSAAHIGSAASLNQLVRENKIFCHCLPQGVIVNLWREIAANRPGLITKVGLNTFFDPRLGGGKMNEVTVEDLVDVIELDGEEWLRYKPFKINVALLRGTTADESGNITMEHEGLLTEALAIAEATKNTGGIVIAQVEYLAKAGTLHPRDIKVPGILVDYVVKATKQEYCWQTEGLYYEPSFSGDVKIPVDNIPRKEFDETKVIVRRACMELKENMIVNLGFGIPAYIAAIAAEENITDKLVLTTEGGSIGGIPAPMPNFGSSYNPDAVITHNAMFDFYDGGGLDIAYLGLAQTDKMGNVNVSKFGDRLTGPGGFVNITQNSKKVVYCGTFMVGAEIAIVDGEIKILKEGKRRKFIDEVEQITFSGKYASDIGQPVLYITERCVFQLKDGQLEIVEIAPGIDLEKDILANMEFKPLISEKLKKMPEELFAEDWGMLKNYIKY
jgi:propionate CoA-transferase